MASSSITRGLPGAIFAAFSIADTISGPRVMPAIGFLKASDRPWSPACSAIASACFGSSSIAFFAAARPASHWRSAVFLSFDWSSGTARQSATASQ